MSYCLNPDCDRPTNSKRSTTCANCGTDLALKGRYRALSAIGQGGFGRTFLGVDLHFPQTPKCVIKQLHFQSDNAKVQDKVHTLFEQEALRLSQLGEHAQIPSLRAYFEEQGRFYLVQEFIDGRSLNPNQWSRSRRAGEHVEQLLTSLLPVLQYIHERNIIHRDIKPENIMLRRSDKQFVLIDFGVARVLSQTALLGGATVIGTTGFMAPEQLRGKVLPASDLYALGATCLNLLTGVMPDEMFDVVAERWQWRDRLPPQTHLSTELTGVIQQLVAPSLRQRAQSAIAVRRSLGVNSAATSHPPQSSYPPSITDRPSLTLALSEVSSINAPTVPLAQSDTPTQPARPTIRIDYTQLKTALKRHRWRSADDETWAILCQLCHKATSTYLFSADFEQFPCADLKAIDFLWRKYSDHRFGLEIQLRIYQNADADYAQFCAQVGWPVHDSPTHRYLQYSLKAPPGHLPSRKQMGGSQVWQQAKQFYGQLARCFAAES